MSPIREATREGIRAERPLTATLTITEFSDPGCPWAWSAEPSRRKLDWLYGDALAWRLRMVVLSESPEDYEEKGFTPELMAEGSAQIAAEHKMPIDTRVRSRMHATLPACRAVVATRVHEPGRERAVFRALQMRHFKGHFLDEYETIESAARAAGISPSALFAWERDPRVLAELEDDKRQARHPSDRAAALDHKLAGWSGGLRYTCPSYEIARDGGGHVAVPGFQPLAAYEVAVANLAPELRRRPLPGSVEEVLRWAGEPLATQEVATLCEIPVEEAREELGRVAIEEHAGADGFWSLRA